MFNIFVTSRDKFNDGDIWQFIRDTCLFTSKDMGYLVPPIQTSISYEYKLLTEHLLRFLSLKGGCTGSSESTLVKMPHCWKSRVTAQLFVCLFELMDYYSVRPN